MLATGGGMPMLPPSPCGGGGYGGGGGGYGGGGGGYGGGGGGYGGGLGGGLGGLGGGLGGLGGGYGGGAPGGGYGGAMMGGGGYGGGGGGYWTDGNWETLMSSINILWSWMKYILCVNELHIFFIRSIFFAPLHTRTKLIKLRIKHFPMILF